MQGMPFLNNQHILPLPTMPLQRLSLERVQPGRWLSLDA
jgi:hypothetical protein